LPLFLFVVVIVAASLVEFTKEDSKCVWVFKFEFEFD
jgi:hypothetical protein